MSIRTVRQTWFFAIAVLVTALGVSALAPVALAATVTLTLSRTSLVFGERVTASGVVEPATSGEPVSITLGEKVVDTVVTDADGAFSLAFFPSHGGLVGAGLGDGATSEATLLKVRPDVRLSHAAPVPFLRTAFTLRVSPSDYSGRVSVRITHRGRQVARLKGRCRGGRLMLRVPLRGIESFSVRFSLAPWENLASRSVSHRIRVPWRRLAVGSTGPMVRGLLWRLADLRIRTPRSGSRFTRATGDAVVAFQKTYGLARDYVVDYKDWRRLERASPPTPRFLRPLSHIEIDKGRQILSVVRHGRVIGVVPVSTGRTGNTRTGSHFVQRKIPVNTLFGGAVVMPRFMTFFRTQGIHGYASVPPYPASHGCVREPLWICDWVYDRSFVGERVYVHP